jgi:hypothetical protein
MTTNEFFKFRSMVQSGTAENHRLFITIATTKISEKSIIAFMLLAKDMYAVNKNVATTLKDELKPFYEKVSAVRSQHLVGTSTLTIASDIDLTAIVKKLFKKKELQSGGNIAAAKLYYTDQMNLLFTALENTLEDETPKEFSVKMTDEPVQLPIEDDDLP